jgi:protein O-GlcNAc transferase
MTDLASAVSFVWIRAMSNVLAEIRNALDQRNLGLADNLCRREIERGVDDAQIWAALARVAQSMGALHHAVRYFSRAAELSPGHRSLAVEFDRAVALASDAMRRRLEVHPPAKRFLLIRETGAGFWAEVFHVLAMTMIAERSGRIPVVHWGPANLFSDTPHEDAFSKFFEPLSDVTAGKLPSEGATAFPDEWSTLRWTAHAPRRGMSDPDTVYAPLLLFREEEIAVSSSWGWPIEILPWSEGKDMVSGQLIEHSLRRHFQSHLKPRTEIARAVDRRWKAMQVSGPCLAIHIRGTDKATEVRNLKGAWAHYDKRIASLLGRHPDLSILLLTDSVPVLEAYRERFGDRLLWTDARRSDDSRGVHNSDHPNRHVLGVEVLVDVLLAARCDYFMGLAASNVSIAVYCAKAWPKDRAWLLGPEIYKTRYPEIYRRTQATSPKPTRRRSLTGKLDIGGTLLGSNRRTPRA